MRKTAINAISSETVRKKKKLTKATLRFDLKAIF